MVYPLSAQYTFADWVQHEQLPVIPVVGIKLGCINHAVLTAQAVQQAGLTLAGWIANDVTPPGRRHQEYPPRCAVCCRRRCWAKSRICRRPSGAAGAVSGYQPAGAVRVLADW